MFTCKTPEWLHDGYPSTVAPSECLDVMALQAPGLAILAAVVVAAIGAGWMAKML